MTLPHALPRGPAPSDLCLEGEGLHAGEGLGWPGGTALLFRGCGKGKPMTGGGHPRSPISPSLFSHHPFPGNLTGGPSLNPRTL